LIEVQKIKSELFTSNVYAITSSENEEVFLIDCGGFESVITILQIDAVVKGIFLTHYHYDHIYFIKEWVERYPAIKFYGSQITLDGLSNPKRNLSFYHDDPVQVVDINYTILSENTKINLFKNSCLRILETEGHCEGSLTFLLDRFVFTGDALIPNIPIVTKLKSGNKEKAKASVQKIKTIAQENHIICPGHLEITKYLDVDWNLYTND
jgi:glyoxylase-like metal-dependent hydrolase (beta-lactamase superfamily II)